MCTAKAFPMHRKLAAFKKPAVCPSEAYPEGALCRDKRGRLPAQLALEQKVSEARGAPAST